METKKELRERERHHITTNECVNKNIPNRTPREYYNDNRERLLEFGKDYYKENREERIDY